MRYLKTLDLLLPIKKTTKWLRIAKFRATEVIIANQMAANN